ncbi:MAG: hypothetical protein R2726_11785 [Acidimicrobiales bacterium]
MTSAPTIDQLLHRVEALEQEVRDLRSAPAAGRVEPDDEATTPSVASNETSVDRRRLLHHAGALAAGAVAGGTALLVTGAEPAAATTSFSGNPAISATGTGGAALVATADGSTTIDATTTNANGQAVRATAPVTSGIGVRASGNLAGVQAESTNGNAVFASTIAGNGVAGWSTSGWGVDAQGDTGLGALGTTYGARIRTVDAAAKAHLLLGSLTGPLGPPPSGTAAHDKGEIAFDLNRDLWLCTAAGTPGTWTKLAGPATAGALHVLGTPTRIYDSRPGNPPDTVVKGPLANGTSRVVSVNVAAAGPLVPAGTTAVLVNAGVVGTSTTGFLALYKNGIAYPGTSNVNWFLTGSIVANLAVVAVDAAARFLAYVSAGSSTDFFVDLVAYWR